MTPMESPYENLIPMANCYSVMTHRKSNDLGPIAATANIVRMQQVHGAKSTCVTGPCDTPLVETDAIFTAEKNLVLAVKTADCLPILIYHPYPFVAAIHAGRVGTQQAILQKTLMHMSDQFGVTADFTLWFGPHICKSCYQIDPALDVHFDLMAENVAQMTSLPLSISRILKSPFCTVCHNDLFFSYRKEKTTERNECYIGLGC